MKKSVMRTALFLSMLGVVLAGCGGNRKSDDAAKSEVSSEVAALASVSDATGAKENTETSGKTEDAMQNGEGINGKLPAPTYTYDGIVDAPSGVYRVPSVYEKNYQEAATAWRKNVQQDLKKITHKLTDDASEEEIEHLFRQYLYLAAYDYEPIESIDRYSYVLYQKEQKDPFTGLSVQAQRRINVEIVLDASGSMAHKIAGISMMDIAKQSIQAVMKQMPKDANVGLRVFGHKGNNQESGKKESCASNESIVPIVGLDANKLNQALSAIQPTGWTCLASAMQEGVSDLNTIAQQNALKSDRPADTDLNILYIITDGLETCGGDPIATAQKLKGGNTKIVLGIIGFNVDARQDEALRAIAKAGDGRYAAANDAAKLTAELQQIPAMSFSDYQWKPLSKGILQQVQRHHDNGLLHNEIRSKRGPMTEYNALNELILYGQTSNIDSGDYANLYPANGKVYQRLQAMNTERKQKITDVLKEEMQKRKQQSQDYIAALSKRLGETVAYIPATSRLDPESAYWSGFAEKGGTVQQIQNEGTELSEQQESAVKQ